MLNDDYIMYVDDEEEMYRWTGRGKGGWLWWWSREFSGALTAQYQGRRTRRVQQSVCNCPRDLLWSRWWFSVFGLRTERSWIELDSGLGTIQDSFLWLCWWFLSSETRHCVGMMSLSLLLAWGNVLISMFKVYQQHLRRLTELNNKNEDDEGRREERRCWWWFRCWSSGNYKVHCSGMKDWVGGWMDGCTEEENKNEPLYSSCTLWRVERNWVLRGREFNSSLRYK